MKQYVAVLLASSAFLLAACGGGGGGGNPLPSGGGGSTPTPVPTATQTPSTTNASGVVVDDANGNPLSGVHVALMPWGPCGPTPAPASITPQNDGCPTPLPSPQATTDASGNFTLNGAPNGHFLLVVGNDVPATPPPGYAPSTCSAPCPAPTPVAFAVQAVVHDNVTLTGGNQTLKAPTLPPVPMYTPPAWETNGDYRIATLDPQYETPCYMAWEYERAQNTLGFSTVDEWLTENLRAVNYYKVAGGLQYKSPPWPGNTAGVLTSYGGSAGGDANCDYEVTYTYNNSGGGNGQILNPRDIWFGGQIYNPSNSVTLLEFPIDPRSYVEPNVPTWL